MGTKARRSDRALAARLAVVAGVACASAARAGGVYPVAGTGCLKAEEPSGQGAGAISRVPLRRRPCYNARALLRVIPTKVLGLIVDLNGRE